LPYKESDFSSMKAFSLLCQPDERSDGKLLFFKHHKTQVGLGINCGLNVKLVIKGISEGIINPFRKKIKDFCKLIV